MSNEEELRDVRNSDQGFCEMIAACADDPCPVTGDFIFQLSANLEDGLCVDEIAKR